MILDVGCGNNQRGTVNIDIAKPPNHCRNFIKASGEYLPFRNETFSTVHSAHVIEHVDNPAQFMQEMLRCSKRQMIIRCPYRFSGYAQGHGHKHPIFLYYSNFLDRYA